MVVSVGISKESLKQRNRLLSRERQIYNAIPIPSTLWSSDKELIGCNNAMAQFFGLSGQDEVMKHFYDFSPDVQPCGTPTIDHITKAQNEAVTNGIARFKWLHVMPDTGERIPVEIIMVRIDIDDGDYLLNAYMHDLRESEAAKKLELEAQIAERESNAKSRFLAQVSHEIRTPLNAIIGVTEIQLQNSKLDIGLEESLLRIHNSSHMLLSLINNLLDLSKVEADKMEIVDRPYELLSLIHDVIQMNTIFIGSKQITFDLNINPQLPAQLVGDSLRIKQICNNVLSNAFKYTETGHVKLSFDFESTEDAGSTILIAGISDSGKGMTKEQVKLLFSEEYIRFEENGVSAIQGTGLGIAITYKLINMMGGSIDVKSEPGMGTTVTLRMPQKRTGNLVIGKEAAENLETFEAASTKSKKRKLRDFIYEPMPYGRVLIVDDSETNLYVAKGLLSPYGLEIETALSGEETIDKVNSGETYDIIFMDYMMPEMDGIETVQNLRKMGYDAPIVALTANAVVGQSEVFMQIGFQGFISKPIDMRHLNAYLEQLIRDKKPLEVVNAARKTAQMFEKSDAQASYLSPQQVTMDSLNLSGMSAPFLRDASRAVEVLESFIAQDIHDASEIKSYTTQVHSMKSGLRIVGEDDLAEFAARLEKFGREENLELINVQTVPFLLSLKAVIAKLLSLETMTEVAEEVDCDIEFLRKQLMKIKESSESYDMATAHTTIDELRQMPYQKNTHDLIEEISLYLLRGDFEEGAQFVQNALDEMG